MTIILLDILVAYNPGRITVCHARVIQVLYGLHAINLILYIGYIFKIYNIPFQKATKRSPGYRTPGDLFAKILNFLYAASNDRTPCFDWFDCESID